MDMLDISEGHEIRASGVRKYAEPGRRIVSDNARKQLIDGLNEDLKGEFQAIIMYRLYASMVQGPYRQELRTFFANEIPEELAHAQMLADKISALGGTPAAAPAPVKVVADAKAMLEAALEAELETIERYVKRRKQAEEAGEHGLAAEFDTLLSDESNHRDELRQMLARWP
jgi:bacterioferritin